MTRRQASAKASWRIWGIFASFVQTMAWFAPAATPALHRHGAEGMSVDVGALAVPDRNDEHMPPPLATCQPGRAAGRLLGAPPDELRMRAAPEILLPGLRALASAARAPAALRSSHAPRRAAPLAARRTRKRT